LPFGGSDAGVLVSQIEILGIGILKTRLAPRLQRKPLKEPLELGKGRMQGGLAQLLPGLLPLLLGKLPFEGDGLLKMKGLEIPKLGIYLEAVQRLCGRIDRRLAVTFGFFKKSEVRALDPFIGWIVLFHGPISPLSSDSSRWVWCSQLISMRTDFALCLLNPFFPYSKRILNFGYVSPPGVSKGH